MVSELFFPGISSPRSYRTQASVATGGAPHNTEPDQGLRDMWKQDYSETTHCRAGPAKAMDAAMIPRGLWHPMFDEWKVYIQITWKRETIKINQRAKTADRCSQKNSE